VGNAFTQNSPTNISLTLTNAATLTWNWQAQYLLTTTTNGNGSVTTGGWFNAGSNVTWTATPAANWHFGGWSGDTNGIATVGNVVTAAMNQARCIVATFVPFTFTSDGTDITIAAYTAGGSVGLIPSTVNGLPVTSIGGYAFLGCTSLNSVTIPAGVTNIGNYAFFNCSNLTNIYFLGNDPSLGSFALFGNASLTVYYLPGTTNWGTFAYSPAVLWNPAAANDGNFGLSANGFGFNITATNNLTVVVASCTNLVNPVWTPVSTLTLIGGTAYFSDPNWSNNPACFYQLQMP